jgi:hypothetical protein
MDWSELTIIAALRPDGLHLWPAYAHAVDAAISALPQPGRGLGRFIAALVGFNQNKITQKVYEGAIGQIRQNVVTEAQELGQEKANEAAAAQNARLAKNLAGNDVLVIQDLEIERLRLRSTPLFALIGGSLQWRGLPTHVGADSPQPPQLAVPESGVTADLHLGSVLTNLAQGYFQSDAVRSVENLMIVTKKIPPDAPPQQGIVWTQNADYPTFLKAVETARAAKDPKVVAIRIKRPGRAPDFAADARGDLVALVHDFLIEVPAPEQSAQAGSMSGPPAKVYRITAPKSEFTISFKITPESQKTPLRLAGRIEAFDPGPGAKVFAVNEDENKAVPLTTFTAAFVLGMFRAKMQGQPVDVPLSNFKLKGFVINSVSGLDPSGWMRLVLTPKPGEIGVPRAAPPPLAPSGPPRVSRR